MSILETFYILFKSDASEVKKGSQEAKKSTDELESSLKNVNKESEAVGKSFLGMVRSAVKAFAAYKSARAIIGDLKTSINYITDLGQASAALDVNSQSLEAWGYAVQRTGGSTQQFQSSLQSLATHLGTTNKVALEVLPKLADTFSRLNNFQATRYGKSLGLDQSTILFLQQGRREVEAVIKRQKELGLVKKEDIEITKKYNYAIQDAQHAYRNFFNQLATPLLPGITKAINYFIEHKDVIVGAFVGIGIAAAALAAPFVAANAAVITLRAAIGLLIAAFGIVFEDIKAFKEGAPSVTGFINKKLQEDRRKNTEKAKKLPSWLQKVLGVKAPDYAIQRAKNAVSAGTATPWAQGALAAGANTTNVNISAVNVNTQATDANGIARDISGSLNDQIKQSNSYFDTGVHS